MTPRAEIPSTVTVRWWPSQPSCGAANLAAACFFDDEQEPPETRLQPRLAALQGDASGTRLVDTGRSMMTRIQQLFDRRRKGVLKGGADRAAYPTAGDPTPEGDARAGRRARTRGRGSDRPGSSLLRSHRRWTGDSTRVGARAEGWNHGRESAAHGEEDSRNF